MNNSLKISIITVSFNSEDTIQDTIESVLSQTYPNIEYIIIDGSSNDKTTDIVKSFGSKIDYFISEDDDGIYDGMNKGIRASTGDIIGILNSDDIYPENRIIEEIVDAFNINNSDTLFGDLVYVNPKKSNKVVRYWKSGIYNRENILKGWMLPHPTFFVRKNIYEKHGLYSEKLKSAADYEMMIRLLYRYKCSVYYLPKILVKMRDGGYSNQSLWNRLRGNNEDVLAWKLNGLKPPRLLRLLKPMLKIRQFIDLPKSHA